MERVTLRKSELIETVKKNRKAHESLYKEAMEGFFEQRLKVAGSIYEKCKKDIEDVDMSALYRVAKPTCHTREYDRVIKMLEHHVGDTVELSNQDFGRYFEDDWEWKQQWMVANSGYTKSLSVGKH